MHRWQAQPPPPPHFCRIKNNFILFYFILPRPTYQDLKTLFLYQTLIDWISNESVGFPALNFVGASSLLENRSLTHVSFYRQLQTFWLDMFTQFIWVVVWVFCSADLTNFIYQLLSVEVLLILVTMPPKRTVDSFFTASSK